MLISTLLYIPNENRAEHVGRSVAALTQCPSNTDTADGKLSQKYMRHKNRMTQHNDQG